MKQQRNLASYFEFGKKKVLTVTDHESSGSENEDAQDVSVDSSEDENEPSALSSTE